MRRGELLAQEDPDSKDLPLGTDWLWALAFTPLIGLPEARNLVAISLPELEEYGKQQPNQRSFKAGTTVTAGLE